MKTLIPEWIKRLLGLDKIKKIESDTKKKLRLAPMFAKRKERNRRRNHIACLSRRINRRG